MIVVNGEVVAQGSQFSLNDVEIVTATIDIEEVRAYRSCISRGHQSINAPTYERHETDFSLGLPDSELDLNISPTPRVEIRIHRPEEEIMLSASCWLWDYLRRSGAGMFDPVL